MKNKYNSDGGPLFCTGRESDIFALAMEKVRKLMVQREAVLEAFVAKYGFEPERFVQCEQRDVNGLTSWYVRRRTDEEMEQLSRTSSHL